MCGNVGEINHQKEYMTRLGNAIGTSTTNMTIARQIIMHQIMQKSHTSFLNELRAEIDEWLKDALN